MSFHRIPFSFAQNFLMYTFIFAVLFGGFIGAFGHNQHHLMPAMVGTAFFRSYPETDCAVFFFEGQVSPEKTSASNQDKTSVAIPKGTTMSTEECLTPKLEPSEGSQSLVATIDASTEEKTIVELQREAFAGNCGKYLSDAQKETGILIVRSAMESCSNGCPDTELLASLGGKILSLDTQFGPSLLFGCTAVAPKELPNAFCAIERLGRHLDCDEGQQMVPLLTVANILCAARANMPEPAFREMAAMLFYSLPDISENELIKYLGCGKGTLKRGMEEICLDGLKKIEDKPNLAGAGRPTTNDELEAMLEPSVTVIAMVECKSEVEDPQSGTGDANKELDGEENNDTSSGNAPSASEIVETVSKEKAPLTVEEVDKALKQLKESVPDMLNQLEERLKYAIKKGEKKYLSSMISFISSTMRKIETSFENIQVEASLEVHCATAQEEIDAYRDDLEKLIKRRDGLVVLLAQIERLSHAVSDLNKAFTRVDFYTGITLASEEQDSDELVGEEMHQQIKRAMKYVPLNRWSQPIFLGWKQCATIAQQARKLASSAAAVWEAWEGINLDDKIDFLQKMDLAAFFDQAQSNLDALLLTLEEHRQSVTVRTAIDVLTRLKESITGKIQEELTTENTNVKLALCLYFHLINPHLVIWNQSLDTKDGAEDAHMAAQRVSSEINKKSFWSAHLRWFGDFQDAVAKASAQPEEPKEQVTEEHAGASERQEESKEQVSEEHAGASERQEESKEQVSKETATTSEEKPEEQELTLQQRHDTVQKNDVAMAEKSDKLQNILMEGKANKAPRKNSRDDAIADALEVLAKVRARYREIYDAAANSDDSGILMALGNLAFALYKEYSALEETYNEVKNNHGTDFAGACKIANKITTKKFANKIEDLFLIYKEDAESLGKNNRSEKKSYEPDKNSLLYRMLYSNGHLSPREHLEIVSYLLFIGKNPFDAVSWIEYIIETTCDNYGDATSDARYCHINQKQLEHAFYYLTGMQVCGKTLWSILTGQMGYTPHPFAKLEQVGTPSPQKEQQLQHIVHKIRAALRKGSVLVISTDTKASITIGRVRNDNGVIMCAPGVVFPVDTHNFAFKMSEVHPNGCTLLEPDDWEKRKNDLAVLHPVGALCLNDMTGYVSLVIGKDTAESMRDMLYRTITLKKEEMKQRGIELEGVLILADGGGSNIANGVTWLSEMMKLSNMVGLPIDMAHYPAGCSKRNPIEHFLWGAISTHWRGRPLLTIESVARYITEAALCSENLNSIECWVDPVRYKSNAEKKAAEEPIATRKKFEKEFADRIEHEFTEEHGDLYKLNCKVFPTIAKSVPDTAVA